MLIGEAAHRSLYCPAGLVSADLGYIRSHADTPGNPLDVHAGLLLVGIEVDPVAREDDLCVYLGAREARDGGNAAARCGLRMWEKDEQLGCGLVLWEDVRNGRRWSLSRSRLVWVSIEIRER